MQVFIDLNTKQRIDINDGRDGVVVEKGLQSVIAYSSQAKHTIPNKSENSGRYLLRSEG